MKTKITVLGAGFGGMELCATLSEALGDRVEVTLIEKADAFVFGFSKLDVMFGHAQLEEVLLPYRHFVKPGVRLLKETVTAIDPAAKKVTTNAGVYEADFLVVALGADYDFDATPGLLEFGHEFYSVAGAEKLRQILPTFTKGKAIVGVCGAPYKCPPAPSEAALMLHDHLLQKGVRGNCEITLVNPLPSPVPPSPDTSKALIAAFAERGIQYLPNRKVRSLDANRMALLDDGTELPFDLFLGVPKHCVSPVVKESGLVEKNWIEVNPRTLETSFKGVYAIGDVADCKAPKAGVFAEGAGRAVASQIIALVNSSSAAELFNGSGICYIEFGANRVAKVDVDFFSGPKPTGTFHDVSTALREEKKLFGSSRKARWFGL